MTTSRESAQHTGNTANTVNHILHELLADGVVATGVCIALAFASPHMPCAKIIQLLAASSLPLINCSG